MLSLVQVLTARLCPAGWSKRVTEENKSKLLPYPLVDSAERDLRKKAIRWWDEQSGLPMPSPPRELEVGPPSAGAGGGESSTMQTVGYSR